MVRARNADALQLKGSVVSLESPSSEVGIIIPVMLRFTYKVVVKIMEKITVKCFE